MISERVQKNNPPLAVEPYDKTWGTGVSGLDENISPFPRVNRLLERTKSTTVSTVDTQRAKLMTEAFRKYAAQPQVKKIALAINHVVKNVDIHIDEDDLIAGEIAAPYWAAPLYPEFSIQWLKEEIDLTEAGELPEFHERHNDKYYVTKENREDIRKLAAWWDGKSQDQLIKAELSDEEKKGSSICYMNDLYTYNGIGHVCMDYAGLIENGFGAYKKKVQAKLDAFRYGHDDDTKRIFWEAQLIALDTSSTYFRRYGELAAKMAEECTDEVRKAELLRISSNCLNVSENPPKDFWEAIQLWQGATNLILIESNGHSVTYGRFDQFMGPFYKNDIANGTLTREQMQELIELSFIKMDTLRKIRNYPETAIASGIGWGGTALNVGGVDADGNDAVNDVSFMVLDAHAHTRITNPWMGVKLSEKNPKEFWIKTFNVCRIGTGEPKVYNDDMYYESLVNYGIPVEMARGWVGVGCVEPEVPGYTYGWHDADYYNGTKVFELAINDGKLADGTQLGPQTGFLKDMKNFDDVKTAFETQMEYWTDRMISTINTMDRVHQRNHPLPYLSLFINDCTEAGVDVSAGGARFNFTGPQLVGLGTVADCMCALKQLIFEERLFTPEEMQQALADNWEGHDLLHAYVNSDKVHHYGNDDDYADEIAKYVLETYCRMIEHRPNARGGEFRPGVYSTSINVPCGYPVGATPDGRCAGEPVSDCLGPCHPQGISHDVRGPLAIANSLSKLNQSRIANGVILNWKFTPETVAGEAGLQNFMNLFHGYFAKGGLQSQFNVVSRDVLESAKAKPKDYRDLMVRVAGYSAYFTELSPDLQNDLIGRTELSF